MEENADEDDEEREEKRIQRNVVIHQKRSHANARNGISLKKIETIAVLLIQDKERRAGRGSGCGGPNSSVVGTELNKVFDENKYCDKNYVACFRHLDDNSIEGSSAEYRNLAVQFGEFRSSFFLIPTFFHDFNDFEWTWGGESHRIRSRMTETYGFHAESISKAIYDAPRFEKLRIARYEYNQACRRAKEASQVMEEIIDPEFMSARARSQRQAFNVCFSLCGNKHRKDKFVCLLGRRRRCCTYSLEAVPQQHYTCMELFHIMICDELLEFFFFQVKEAPLQSLSRSQSFTRRSSPDDRSMGRSAAPFSHVSHEEYDQFNSTEVINYHCRLD